MKQRFLIVYVFLVATTFLCAQPRLSSNKETHKFGQIEWKRPVTVEYAITNSGNQPLVLSNVTTSCACTVADWTKTPILPGEKGFVKAVFDAKALGHFDKSIGIYSNATPHLAYLHFVGEVVREVKDFSRSHPYQIGKIRLDKTEFSFPDVNRGEMPQITFSVVNLSDRPYEPVLMHLPSYLKMEKDPQVLLKGKRGSVTLTLDSKELHDFGLTRSSVYLSRFSGDKVSEENEIPVTAILLPDFSKLTEEERRNAPVIRLSETEIDLTEALRKKSRASHTIVVTNSGRSPLVVSKLQVFNPAVGVSLKKAMLQPGESTKLHVTISKRNTGNKKYHLRLLMITNDPVTPKVEINVKR